MMRGWESDRDQKKKKDKNNPYVPAITKVKGENFL